MTRVKICCIASVEEARLAVQYGASALGLVSAMPSGPGVIAEALIAEIVEDTASTSPAIDTFLLTSQTDPAKLVKQQGRCGTNTVQICDDLPPNAYATLRESLPGVRLVPVIHVADADSVAHALRMTKDADALLLDSGNPSLAIKELGGTGRTHDWSLSAEIVKQSSIPVYLAGGLNAENVGEAIRTVRPYGVDVCSGVRTTGSLDESKLIAFMAAVAAAGDAP